MKTTLKIITGFLLGSLLMTVGRAEVRLASPDGKLAVVVGPDASGHLTYAIESRGHAVLRPSPIGVVVDGVDLGTKATSGEVRTYEVTERFPWRGERAEIAVRGRGAKIAIRAGSGGRSTAWELDVRCYNEGVAYRCLVPGAGERRIERESAAWNFPEGTVAWCNPETKSGEGIYRSGPLNGLIAADFPSGINLPTTCELPGGGFALLTEADTMGYSGLTLEPTDDWRLQSSFRHDPKGFMLTGPITTPWRVCLMADDLNALVDAGQLVPALCAPPDPKLFPAGIRTEWLKPGRALWQWWAFDLPGADWSKQKGFVDKAAALGCQYYLVDAGWETPERGWASEGKGIWDRMRELCDYAAAKNVGNWIWHSSVDTTKGGGTWAGLVTPASREEFLQHCAAAGVKGVKVDFMDSESHATLAFYADFLRRAAAHRVMVDFHGANKPAGEERTWPHEMTREGVRGLEFNKWSVLPPSHYATLPFTRYVVGHGDFTPTTFQRPMLKGTTVGLQLASAVVYTSPFLCWADAPDVYLKSPAVDIIRGVPTVWDETRVLPGSKIGDLAVFARRAGDEWYVAILNGGGEREYPLEFAFLGRARMKADLFSDLPGDPLQWEIRHGVPIDARTKLSVWLSAGGGFLAQLRRDAGEPARP